MTARQAVSIAQLLRASSDDEKAMRFPLPDSGYGFHAQQAVEELYKVLLALKTGEYPFSHDLPSLRRRVVATGLVLPVCSFRLEELSEYAGNARYNDPMELDEKTREVLRQCIADLRGFVIKQSENCNEGDDESK